MQGLDNGLRSVVGGVGMGLVGIVARPMGGVASLVSMTSDGLLYGMGAIEHLSTTRCRGLMRDQTSYCATS